MVVEAEANERATWLEAAMADRLGAIALTRIVIIAAAYDATCSTLPEYAPQRESAANRRILRDNKT